MKVIVGISGGVDSSVTALLLKQQGYEVEALFMKNWTEETASGECSWEEDVEDALKVCEILDIPINTIDLSMQYWDRVFSSTLEDFRQGLTPNPDILCNQEIKFRSFLEQALELGADKIATGHYARITSENGTYRLLKGIDAGKDQSYFLCRLDQEQLSRTMFPVGNMRKTDVRELARQNGLPVHGKKDSTGICFIGERPFKEFLGRYIPVNKGPIMSLDGRTLGEHDGVSFYTIGQRQGLGIGGVRGAGNRPWYVVAKDNESNTLYVAQGGDNSLLFSRQLLATDLHWIDSHPGNRPFQSRAKTRYRQPEQECSIRVLDDGLAEVGFNRPQKAVTPGQYIVFYDDDICLGGGVIASAGC